MMKFWSAYPEFPLSVLLGQIKNVIGWEILGISLPAPQATSTKGVVSFNTTDQQGGVSFNKTVQQKGVRHVWYKTKNLSINLILI